MAQEDHFVRYSNSTGSPGAGVSSNNRSKTPKHKKIPQRGLGVAQLEKLRIEEQRKKEALQAAHALANSAIGPGNDSLQGPNIEPSPIPASPSPPSFLPSIALYRSPGHLGPAQFTKQSNDCGGEETGFQGICNWPRLWTGEYNSSLEGGGGMEKERIVVDGFAFCGPQVNANLQFEPNGPVYQFHRPPPPMVNVSSGMSPPPVSKPQIGLPSIQNVRYNNYTPSWPEDDKIVVGSKRSHPFSLEGTVAPSFLGSNFHSPYGISRSRSDELACLGNEPRNKYASFMSHIDGASNSTEQNPSEDARLIVDFLSLAPPVGSFFPPLNSKNKHHPLDFLGHGHHQGPDLSDNKSLSGQENLKGSQSRQPEYSSSKEQAFSFFPIKPQIEQSRNGNGDKGEKLDLNLKL